MLAACAHGSRVGRTVTLTLPSGQDGRPDSGCGLGSEGESIPVKVCDVFVDQLNTLVQPAGKLSRSGWAG